MARVTSEDCIDKVDNRFELVLLASHRSRMISDGAPITIDRDRDKNPIVALREIADGTLSPEDLREEMIHSMQTQVEVDDPEEEAYAIESDDEGKSEHFGDISEEELLRKLENLTPPERDD